MNADFAVLPFRVRVVAMLRVRVTVMVRVMVMAICWLLLLHVRVLSCHPPSPT